MSEADELREALAGMVYLYDRFGFSQGVRSNTDPTVEWLNIIMKAKHLSKGAAFTPPADYPLATADARSGDPK